MMKYLLIASILFIGLQPAIPQEYITGRIIDRKTREPLAFVNIVYNSRSYGTVSNIDGLFNIEVNPDVEFLKFSYVGYHSQWLDLESAVSTKNLVIKLNRKTYDIEEVIVIPGTNPAHRIIHEAVKNRDLNNPEKMQSFSYQSYNKMYFTLHFDTISPSGIQDTSSGNTNVQLTIGDPEADPDSSLANAMNFLEKQHLFLMEFISEREFLHPDKNNEIVTASRVSGLKDPTFTMLATQIQSFAFYDNLILIWDKKYLNPISRGTTGRYLFILEDTMYTPQNDTLFVISFRPLHGKNFDGLRGILHINSNRYAIQNVIAEAAEQTGMFRIRIQQKYEWLEDRQWFPVELNTDFILTTDEMKVQNVPVSLVGIGKTYLSNIRINPELPRKGFDNIELEVDDDAHKKSDEYWDQHRLTPLTAKDTNTYVFIDSIGEEANLDTRLRILETVASGYIPWRFLNIDYKSLINYNRYEGFRLGIGLQTNEKISRWFNVGGKIAYGTKDRALKYGGHLNIFFDPPSNTFIRLKYSYDVTESAGISYLDEIPITSSENFRSFLIANKDITDEREISFNSSFIRYLSFKLYLNQSIKQVTTEYRYSMVNGDPEPTGIFHFTEIGLNTRYAYSEKFIETPRGNRISLGTDYPIVYFNLVKGLEWLKGDWDYLKMEMIITKSFLTKSLGDTRITLVGGLVDSNVPYPNIYNGLGSYGKFTIETMNSFGTMRMNEFVLDRFAYLFFQQDFGKLLFKKEKFQPGIIFATNAGFGDLYFNSNHENIDLQTMKKGYFESGILVRNILRQWFIGYGLGAFYRYGPYSLIKTIDNFAFKFTITFNI